MVCAISIIIIIIIIICGWRVLVRVVYLAVNLFGCSSVCQLFKTVVLLYIADSAE